MNDNKTSREPEAQRFEYIFHITALQAKLIDKKRMF